MKTPTKPPPTTESMPSVDDMKASVRSLAEIGTRDVKIVREAFAAGTAPLQRVGSGSVSSYVSGLSNDAIGSKIVKSTAHLGLKTSTAGSSVLPPKPQLDSLDVIEDRGGMLDQFSVRVVVSLPIADRDKVTSIKIMRAKMGPVSTIKPAVSALSLAPSMPGLGVDRAAAAAFRAAEIGVGNKMTEFIHDDPNVQRRSVISPDARDLRPTVPPVNTNRSQSASGLLEVAGADRSVVENLTFYVNRRSLGAVNKPSINDVAAGKKTGINVLAGNYVAESSSGIVELPNSLNFTEVARIDMRAPGVKQIGEFIVSSYVDKAVVYGSSFTYYVSCIGQDGVEGPRSRLAKVSVVMNRPPNTPRVAYSVIGGNPRFVISCPPGTDHVEVFRAGRPVDDSIRLATDQSIVSQGPSMKVGEFWHIRDVGLGPDGTATLVDTKAVPGDSLSYRFYAVDPYGLKCQTPFSCSIKMPEHGTIPLPVPSITVEQTSGQPNLSVRIQVDDDRVTGFIIQRRDVTISELAFHQPNQPEWVNLGVSDPKRSHSRVGPHLKDADWPLYIPAHNGAALFIDSTVRIDRKYKYAVRAIDRRGNKTPLVGSAAVGVYSKTVIDPPTAFTGEVISDEGVPTGILLKWTGGTNDFDPNSIVGDQDVLAATSVRSVFQVERREVGAPFWDAMPATSESYFFDKMSLENAPAFRPPYVVAGRRYEYRVLAMQSGGFISARTEPVSIQAVPAPTAPRIVWAKSTPLSSNPLSVVVSWDMPGDFVERWEVERAVTNKLYGEQVTSMDSKVAKSLKYVRVADVTPEASRARGISADVGGLDPAVYVGNRFYIDGDVDRANSYFYRVRTVGPLGTSSEWSYCGIVLRDVAFDSKFYSTLSDAEKVSLAGDKRPIKRSR